MLYATETRKAIVDFLRGERRYHCAAEIYEALRHALPKMALSTVYRTLERLSEMGVVSQRNAGRGAEYVYCGELHHHHAVCSDCGRVEDMACFAIDGIHHELLEHFNFVLADHEMTFYGTCSACHARGKAP